MAYFLRFTEPQKVGCIVRLKKRCGDKRCACCRENKRHTSFGLKYREYDQTKGGIVQRITYLKAKDVPHVQAELEQVKGQELLEKVGDEAVVALVMRFPHLTQSELHRKAYELYGTKPIARD